MGSHVFGAAMVVPLFAIRLAPGVYQIPAVHAVAHAVLTNTIPISPYRGAGRPEAAFLIEQLLDRAGRVLGLDPIEIRRRNFIPPSAMPHKIQTGITYDSGDFAHVMDECLKLADWDGFSKRAAESKKNGKLRGRGIGYFLEEAAVFNDRMVLRFDPSGMLTILAGTHSHGQGHETVYAQMVSEWLGVPFENVRFVQGDTDAVPFGRGTYGSRSMQVGGNALKRAADSIIEKAKPMAALMLEAASGDIEFKDGSFRIVGTDRALPLTAVAKGFYRPAMLPPQFDVGLEASGTFAAEPPNYPNGCHLCEVEIDPETGAVTLARYAAVDDVGRVMNRLLCEGPGSRRRRARRRPSADGSDRVRRRRATRHRQFPGLRHAAGGRFSRPRLGTDREFRPRPIRSASKARAKPAPPARRRRSSAPFSMRSSRSASSRSTCRRRRAKSGRRSTRTKRSWRRSNFLIRRAFAGRKEATPPSAACRTTARAARRASGRRRSPAG